jgi:hypothetical protein
MKKRLNALEASVAETDAPEVMATRQSPAHPPFSIFLPASFSSTVSYNQNAFRGSK